jgi:hypothetical protein
MPFPIYSLYAAVMPRCGGKNKRRKEKKKKKKNSNFPPLSSPPHNPPSLRPRHAPSERTAPRQSFLYGEHVDTIFVAPPRDLAEAGSPSSQHVVRRESSSPSPPTDSSSSPQVPLFRMQAPFFMTSAFHRTTRRNPAVFANPPPTTPCTGTRDSLFA